MKLTSFAACLFILLSHELLLAQNTWIQKPFFGGGNRNGATGFSIGSKGYVGTGWSDTAAMCDFWAYDTVTNAWTQVADFGGSPRERAVGFSIGMKGYVGTGLDTATVTSNKKKDFWEYNSVTNIWTQKANFGSTGRYSAVGFSIGSKGYIGTGQDGAKQNDFWEYDTASNTWIQKAFLAGLERYGAVGFSIGSKGYIGGGYINTGEANDFWEYNPGNDTWTQKANLIAGSGTGYNSAFTIGSRGYVMTSNSGSGSDLECYNPATNTWILVANLAQARHSAVGFSIGNHGYISTGQDGGGRRKDLWRYTPCAAFPVATITPSGSTTICPGQNVTLTASAGASYIWWTSETTQSIVVSSNLTTAVTVTDSCGSATSSPVTVTVASTPTVTASPSTTVCAGSCTTLSASGASGYYWSPGGQTNASISVCPTANTTYSVVGMNAAGCTSTGSVTVSVAPLPVVTLPGNSTVCSGQSLSLCANGGIAYSWNTGATTSCISISPTASSTYTVIVSDGTCADTVWTTATIDSFGVSLNLVQDSVNPLVWYGYPAYSGGSMPVVYQWDFGDGTTSTQPYPTHTYSVAGNYVVCLNAVDANGCSVTSCDTTYKLMSAGAMQTLIVINPLTGIPGLHQTDGIRIYPNPVSGQFSIESAEMISAMSIRDAAGRILLTYSIEARTAWLDISDLDPGIYFITVHADDRVRVQKLIKQ